MIVDLTGTVRDVRRLKGQKLALFPTPPRFNAVARGDSVRISTWNLISLKTRMMGLSGGEDLVDLSSICLVTIPACDTQTDGRKYYDGNAMTIERCSIS